MDRTYFQQALMAKSAEVIRLLTTKNKDYAPAGGINDDPFLNYSLGAMIAGITTQQSMVARMAEKLIRVGNLINTEGEPAVKDEKVVDTLRDIEGISLLLRQYLEELKQEEQAVPQEGVLDAESEIVYPPPNKIGALVEKLLGR